MKNEVIRKFANDLYVYVVSCFSFSLILLTGCAEPQRATYVAQSFEQIPVSTITILPIVDGRQQRQFEFNESELQQIVYPVVEAGLHKKGYSIEYSDDIAGVRCLKFGRSTNLKPECLQTVGPPNSQSVLVLFLQDFQMRTPYGGAVSAKISGVLFDRPKGLLLWRDLEYAGLSQRELVGPNRNTLITNDVIQLCVEKLIASIPKRVTRVEE